MKIKPDYVLRDIAGDFVLVPTGEAVAKYNGLFAVSEVGARIIELFGECATEEEIAGKIVEEYDTDIETASADVKAFVASLREKDILED